jgi:hypothetical protein
MATTRERQVTTQQVYGESFDVFRGGEKLPVYISRTEIGGGDHAYHVVRGDAWKLDGEVLSRGFESRKAAAEWIGKNV